MNLLPAISLRGKSKSKFGIFFMNFFLIILTKYYMKNMDLFAFSFHTHVSEL